MYLFFKKSFENSKTVGYVVENPQATLFEKLRECLEKLGLKKFSEITSVNYQVNSDSNILHLNLDLTASHLQR